MTMEHILERLENEFGYQLESYEVYNLHTSGELDLTDDEEDVINLYLELEGYY